MTRVDKFRTPEYFQKYISDQTVRIDKFKKVLEECGTSEKMKIYRILSDRYKDLISAQFSFGEELPKIKNNFEEYAIYISKVGFSCYSEYIDFLSLQVILDAGNILIEVPQEYHDDLSTILNDFINNTKSELTGSLFDESYYSVFVDYCNGIHDFNFLIDYVSTKWYRSSMEFYWYDSHLNDQDVYTGYWCYVASAVIRLKGEYDKIKSDNCFII